MTIELPDLSTLTFTQFVSLALLTAAADTLWNVIVALNDHTFKASVVADFLVSHVAMRVVPLTFGAILGFGELGIPAMPVALGVSLGGLAAYVIETINSMKNASTTPPPPTSQ